MNVCDLMTTDLVTVNPTASLRDAARLMRDRSVGTVLVMQDHQLLGIISDRDLAVRAMSEGWNPNEHQAREVMTADPITIEACDDPLEAAKVIGAAHVRRLPVVDDGNVVGLVSASDIADYIDGALAGLLEEMEKALH